MKSWRPFSRGANTDRNGDSSPRPPDQATGLRRLAHAQPQRAKRVIAISSGKGGVGKSNAAVNLAVCLAARKLSVTLVDLDVGLANADLLLGVHTRYDLSQVLDGKVPLRDAVVHTNVGLDFVAGATAQRSRCASETLDAHRMRAWLEGLDSEVVLLDCAAGVRHDVMCGAKIADELLLVTTPEPTALTDAYAVLKTLYREGYSSPASVLVNMVDSRVEAKHTYQRLREVAQKFLELPVADAGYILHDTHVELAVRQRKPFVVRFPKCSASVCVAAVAARLAQGASVRHRHNSWRRKVASYLS